MRTILHIALICALGGLGSRAEAADRSSLAAATLVVFNSNVPESVALAKFYAEKRGIPPDHVIGLACSKEEEISREEYDRSIAQPLRAAFEKQHWWTWRDPAKRERGLASNSIQFIALIKGIPLKIRHAADYPGDKRTHDPAGDRNEASVDSELSLLGRISNEISGLVPNPYYKSSLSIADLGDPSLMLVCRLDAPTAETVRRMIVDSIATEKDGLWGRAYIDGAHNTSGGLVAGDRWLEQAGAQLRKVGVPVVFENSPALFPSAYPMTDCALYYGWYAGTVTGPFTHSDFRFVPGAVAIHIHSFSAATLRDPNANWVGPLLQKGAAGSIGNVYEPYLPFTVNPALFNERLLQGFTFAESAYMSVPGLSWMSVMVGDPLYRPYANWSQSGAKRDSEKSRSPWRMEHDFAMSNADKSVQEYRALGQATASRANNGPMMEDIGLVQASDGDMTGAVVCFEQARALYSNREDILRVVLEEADILIKQGNRRRALDLVRSVLSVLPNAPASELLRQMERDLVSSSPKSGL